MDEKNREKEKAYKKEYYKRNKEKINADSKKWAENNPERRKEIANISAKKNREKRRKWQVDWFERNFEKRLLAQAKNTAKTRGMAFDLELSDIVIPENCPFLGVPLSKVVLQGRIPNRASIDRKDSSKGYIKGNVQVISSKANRMKNDATKEELVTFATNVLELNEKGEL